jgi:chaperonin GroES
VLVKKVEDTQTKGGIILPENQSKVQGEVVAVGSGARSRDGQFYKPVLKVGDKVILPEYGGNKVDLNGEIHWIYREGDIIARFTN